MVAPHLLWHSIYWRKVNFPAQVESDRATPVLPDCYEFEGRLCLGWMQSSDTSLCQDQGKVRRLQCRPDPTVLFTIDPQTSEPIQSVDGRYKWLTVTRKQAQLPLSKQ